MILLFAATAEQSAKLLLNLMLIYEHQNFYLKAPALCLKSTGFTHSSI
jgi:hypothetical protein